MMGTKLVSTRSNGKLLYTRRGRGKVGEYNEMFYNSDFQPGKYRNHLISVEKIAVNDPVTCL